MSRSLELQRQQRDFTILLKEVTEVERIRLIPSLTRFLIHFYKHQLQADPIIADVRLRGALKRILSGIPDSILFREQQSLLRIVRHYCFYDDDNASFINLPFEPIYNDNF